MKHRTKILALIGLVVIIVFTAVPILAADDVRGSSGSGGLIPCGTKANPNMCTVCDFFKLIQNIINFFLYDFSSRLW
jgi:hypothetical protein